MHSPVLAIGWSLWARHRAGHAVVLASIPICAVLYRVLLAMIPVSDPRSTDFLNELPLTIVPMALSLVWVLYACAQTESDPKRGFTGFPPRMFTLPLATRFLVTWHLGFGVTALLLVHLAWVWLVFAPLGVHFALRWPLLLLATAMISFQGAVWGLASFPWFRALVIGVSGLLLGPLIAIASVPEIAWIPREPIYALWTLAALPGAYAGALALVAAERRGGWEPWAPLRRLAHRCFDALLLRRNSFASPAHALLWLEWRRKGWLAVVWLALSIVGAIVLFPVMVGLGLMGLPPWFAVVMMLPWPVFMGSILGAFVARPDRSGEVALSPFHALKPITNGQIVFIKLKVAAGVTIGGWLLSVPLAWVVTLWPQWREMWLEGDMIALSVWLTANLGWLAALVVIAMITTWKAMVETLALGLTGHARVITLRSMLGMVLVVGAMSVGIWFFRRPESLTRVQPWFYLGIGSLMVVKIRGLFRSFTEVRRHALVSPKPFRVLLALWFGVALSIVGGTALIWFHLPLPKLLVLAAAAWLWPAGELAQAVINLSANRHR